MDSAVPNSSGVNNLVKINKKQNEMKEAKPIPAERVMTFLKKEDETNLLKYEEVSFIIFFLISLLNYLLDSPKKKHLHFSLYCFPFSNICHNSLKNNLKAYVIY